MAELVAPACDTLTLRPPIVTVPDRAPVLVFAAAVIVTDRPPATLEVLVEIQSRLSLTDQLQPVAPLTDTLRLPVALSKLTDDGFTPVGDVGHVAPACDTLTLRPPIVTVPDRAPVLVFAAAVIVTDRPPATLEALVEIQ